MFLHFLLCFLYVDYWVLVRKRNLAGEEIVEGANLDAGAGEEIVEGANVDAGEEIVVVAAENMDRDVEEPEEEEDEPEEEEEIVVVAAENVEGDVEEPEEEEDELGGGRRDCSCDCGECGGRCRGAKRKKMSQRRKKRL
ncbi:hypothetical protein LIER_36424 [Lithospermum erythrorhizon]|uniref:Uncharacterized protein n=1 Tax=Lithospermum erythrorhizon TaxID=34254 RepID=A0AAV3P5T5_LITER